MGFGFFPIHALLASVFFLSYFLRLVPPSSEKGLILVSLYKDILGLKGLQIFIESRKVLGPLWSIFLFSGCFAKSTFQPYSFFLVFGSFLTRVYPFWRTHFTMTTFLTLFPYPQGGGPSLGPIHHSYFHRILCCRPCFIEFFKSSCLNFTHLLFLGPLGLVHWFFFHFTHFLGASWASPFIWLLGFSY